MGQARSHSGRSGGASIREATGPEIMSFIPSSFKLGIQHALRFECGHGVVGGDGVEQSVVNGLDEPTAPKRTEARTRLRTCIVRPLKATVELAWHLCTVVLQFVTAQQIYVAYYNMHLFDQCDIHRPLPSAASKMMNPHVSQLSLPISDETNTGEESSTPVQSCQERSKAQMEN
ncbi:hypothetical protein K438DRAFT_1754739 [Mycena galopus ATCC 62051]|nr:hypothetical protein K438DRAFT_1754739 [Mycena galopus ATCC 62051]